MLVESFVGYRVQCVGEGVPHDAVDADDPSVTQADEEHVLAVDRFGVNGAAEGDRQPRLHVEAIERVEYRDVLTVRRPLGAVRLRQVHPEAGQLAGVLDRERVARERSFIRRDRIEERVNSWRLRRGRKRDRRLDESAKCHQRSTKGD
jgi:hypothetical protein